jgi:dimethylhistidine N-methyltransferase
VSLNRFQLRTTPATDAVREFAADVRAGLLATPKHLSFRYFYDEEGSRLFEAICELPEYYLTRAETEILRERAVEIASRVPAGAELVELGSGSARKTRLLIEALLARGPLRYRPIDISESILRESALALLDDYPALEVAGIAAEYRRGLAALADEGSARGRLILWLGSNVGNFDRVGAVRFLGEVRATMAVSDRLLIGVDLRKGREVLEPAYDDAAGVTARFNLNLLVRVNRELGGGFDLNAFQHRAVYDEEAGRIDMYLISRRRQVVPIEHLGVMVTFDRDEAIHTESSYKYSLAEIDRLARATGFTVDGRWLDGGQRFSVTLLAPTRS